MLRSMYSGISGLKNFQTKLDVIGNNIANVNTHGFKKGRVMFKDIISQTQASPTAPSATRGGINSKQVGLGVQLAAIDTIHSTGSMQTTGRALDLAIAGEGLFMVGDSAGGTPPTGYTDVVYTRAGNFYMDKDGYLVNTEGKYLVGFATAENVNEDADSAGNAAINGGKVPTEVELTPVGGTASVVGGDLYGTAGGTLNPQNPYEDKANFQPIKIPTTAKEVIVSQNGVVTFTDAKGVLRYAGTVLIAKFPNAGGLDKVGSNYYRSSSNSGEPVLQFGTQAGIGAIQAGSLEMSNVDLSEEFTEMIIAQRGFQANTKIVTTSDEVLQELVNLKR